MAVACSGIEEGSHALLQFMWLVAEPPSCRACLKPLAARGLNARNLHIARHADSTHETSLWVSRHLQPSVANGY